MMRLLSIAAVGALALEPLLVQPDGFIGFASVTAGIVAAAGLAHSQVKAALIGCVFGLVAFTAAIWPDARSHMAASVLYGLTLVFVLDLTAFRSRRSEAQIDSAVLRRQSLFWLRRAVSSVVLAAGTSVTGWALSGLAPAWSMTALVALGSLAAFGFLSSAGPPGNPEVHQ
jgi:hypothetical protein